MNFNGRTFAHTDQKGVRVVEEDYYEDDENNTDVYGWADMTHEIYNPNNCNVVEIYKTVIQNKFDDLASARIMRTLGHEIGHAAGLHHHVPKQSVPDCLMRCYVDFDDDEEDDAAPWYEVDFFCITAPNCKSLFTLH